MIFLFLFNKNISFSFKIILYPVACFSNTIIMKLIRDELFLNNQSILKLLEVIRSSTHRKITSLPKAQIDISRPVNYTLSLYKQLPFIHKQHPLFTSNILLFTSNTLYLQANLWFDI